MTNAPERRVRGEAVDDYLKAIHELSSAGLPGRPRATLSRVGTQELADHMRVSAASASRMLKQLDKLGYVSHEPYHGATLTESGERAALEVIRHHRLLETYLHDALGYGWDEVHAEADRLEHYISEDLEARIFDRLGRPGVDPHGDVIPTLEGALPPEQAENLAGQLPLADAPTATPLTVRRVPSDDPEKLRYLREIGLVPGACIEIIERQPYGGGLRLTVGDSRSERVLGEELAGEITVSRVGE